MNASVLSLREHSAELYFVCIVQLGRQPAQQAGAPILSGGYSSTVCYSRRSTSLSGRLGSSPRVELFPERVPHPALDKILLSRLLIPPPGARRGLPALLNVEAADGAEHVPAPAGVLGLEGAAAAHVVDEAEAAAAHHGVEVGGGEGAVARLGDGAHGGDGQAGGGWQGADEALEDGPRGARVGRQVHVDVGDEGGGGEADEEDGDDAAEGDWGGGARISGWLVASWFEEATCVRVGEKGDDRGEM